MAKKSNSSLRNVKSSNRTKGYTKNKFNYKDDIDLCKPQKRTMPKRDNWHKEIQEYIYS